MMSRSDRSSLPDRLLESAAAHSDETITRLEAAGALREISIERDAATAARDAWHLAAMDYGCDTPEALRTLLAGLAELASSPHTTAAAIAHLRDLIAGSGACLSIEDGIDHVEITHGSGLDTARVPPADVSDVLGCLRRINAYQARRAA